MPLPDLPDWLVLGGAAWGGFALFLLLALLAVGTRNERRRPSGPGARVYDFAAAQERAAARDLYPHHQSRRHHP